MIDINKKYKTRDGRDVKIFMVNGGSPLPVIGAYYDIPHDNWIPYAWPSNGLFFNSSRTKEDLIEVKPEITRWLAVNPLSGYESLESLKYVHRNLDPNYSAIVKVTFHVGDGFEEDK